MVIASSRYLPGGEDQGDIKAHPRERIPKGICHFLPMHRLDPYLFHCSISPKSTKLSCTPAVGQSPDNPGIPSPLGYAPYSRSAQAKLTLAGRVTGESLPIHAHHPLCPEQQAC